MYIGVLWEYRYIIIVVLCAMLFALLEWERTKTILYALMLQAKRMAKDAILASGKEQEDWVVEKAKILLPKWIMLFFSDDRLRIFVRLLFAKLKDYIDDGQVNGSRIN